MKRSRSRETSYRKADWLLGSIARQSRDCPREQARRSPAILIIISLLVPAVVEGILDPVIKPLDVADLPAGPAGHVFGDIIDPLLLTPRPASRIVREVLDALFLPAGPAGGVVGEVLDALFGAARVVVDPVLDAVLVVVEVALEAVFVVLELVICGETRRKDQYWSCPEQVEARSSLRIFSPSCIANAPATRPPTAPIAPYFMPL